MFIIFVGEKMEENYLAGLSKPWQKFFKRFDEIDSLKVSEWKEVHILAYICKKFEERFDRKFAITIKGAPSKCSEIYLVKRIGAMLATTNKNTIKEYIDYIYEYKVKKNPFRTIGFFIVSGFANEFLQYKAKKTKEFDRSTEVPEVYKTIAQELGLTIKTYGDLAFIQMSLDRSEDKESNYYILMGNLELMGLDLNRLRILK